MKSIRIQLLLWLVPSFVIIAILAGASLYLSEKRRLDTNIDNELNKLARTVKLVNKMPTPRFAGPIGKSGNIAANTKLILGDESNEFFLQSWNEKGETLSKSSSLNELQIIRSLKQGNDEISYNGELTSGEAIRVLSFSLRKGPRVGVINVSVAISIKGIYQELTRFAIRLIIGGIFFCFLLSVILVYTIRKTLKPIQNLSEQVSNVEAGSLHNRLIETDIPTEINPLVNRLNQLLERLELSFARERQFNSDLAHELRTPLAAIRTTSEVALKWPEQASIDDYRYIAESSAQLQQTIDSLLSLVRIENTGAEKLSENVDVSLIIDECLSLQSVRIKERNLRISKSIYNPSCLQSDPRLLRIIISNLINNAVEYSPADTEVMLNCEATSNSEKNTAILTVINSAPDLNEEDLVAMFDRLWRKDASRTGTKHTGLGLSIAHTAAKALSLELTAELQDKQILKMSLISF
ncbi:ATP-binding protein [Paraglaciecola sp.]|uniref:ATP-binding protein n=1 Tax=Paraglaciecola sp. TaxID=1920173 RepID=UPI003EF12DA6